MISVKENLDRLTPRLRRYARALTQAAPVPSETADELVHASLLRAMVAAAAERQGDVALLAFAILTDIHRDSLCEHRSRAASAGQAGGMRQPPRRTGPHSAEDEFVEALACLTLDEREALFLVAVEQFSYAQAMQILHLSRASLIARLIRARARLSEVLAMRGGKPGRARPAPYLRVVK